MAAPTLITSILTGGVNNHATTSEEANAVYTDFVSQGVVGSITNTLGIAPSTGSFAVNASGTPDTNINISTGVAVVTGTPTSQNSQKFRVKCTVTGTATISANSSGSTKYDWVYVKLDATNLNAPNTAGDNVATIVTSRSSSASTDDGTPPTYGINIAVVTVANGFSTITNSNIRDTRTQSTITATGTSTSQDWYSLGYQPSTVTYNGNRNYSLTFSSTDLTSTLSPGSKLKLTRTVAAPTQCTSLNGTTQYYSKSSPAGTTFTDDFVCTAYIKLSSYQAGSIISRYDGTSGWDFSVNSSGQVQLTGYNAGAANFSYVLSYQSVPLNKWVRVTAQLDMSSFTNTATTSYIMIDGVDVSASVARGGTNPTALVQAGSLNIGARNGGSQPLAGKIAQAAYFSAKVTQATMLTYSSQTFSGSETSEVSAYSFNNTINDLNANANNLTANGSAVATNADSPYGLNSFGTATGSTEYGVVTTCTFSTNTTVVVQVPEGNAIPTSGGVSAVSYSTVKSPYGFPAEDNLKLQAYDSGGTTTLALTALMTKFVTNNPIDNIKIGNSGSAGGTFFINQIGSQKTVTGSTGTISITGSGFQSNTSVVNYPTSFFTTVDSLVIGSGNYAATQYQSAGYSSASTSTVTLFHLQFNGTNGTQTATYTAVGS